MNAFRRLIVISLLAVLALVLVVFSVGAVSYITVLDPSFAESRLDASGFYEDFSDNALEVLSQNLEGSPQEVDQAVARLTPVFEDVLTPQLIQSNTEKVVVGVADWLNGETDVPRFLINTGDIRADLNASLVDYLNEYLPDLPVCPADTNLKKYDPFTADCRPPGELHPDVLATWTDEFTAELPLLGREQVAGSDLVDDPDAAFWRIVPQSYFWGKVAVGVFFALLVLISALVLAASSNRPTVLRRLGHVSLFDGVVLLVGGGVISLFLGGHGLNFIASGEPERVAFAEQIVIPVLRSFAHGIGAWLMGFGAIVLFLCLVFYFVSRWLKRHHAPGSTPGTPPGQAPPPGSAPPPSHAPPPGQAPPSKQPRAGWETPPQPPPQDPPE